MEHPDRTRAAPPPGDVFITGGSGRIGTGLRHRLRAAGYRVRFTDIAVPAGNDLEGYVRTDLADQDGMAEAMTGARAVVHLAGHPRDVDWPTLQERNVTGTFNAIRAARRAGATTIIYASSNQAFGMYAADTPLSDCLVPRPAGLYGVSKVFGEALLRAEADTGGLVAFAWRICAFKPEPTTARDLRLWCSPDDAARLVDSCLRSSDPGFHPIWGVSANTRLEIDDPVARRIGYKSLDDAETHLPRLHAAGVNTRQVSEWRYLGGEKATDWAEGGGR